MSVILGFCQRCGKATDEHDNAACRNPVWMPPAPAFGIGAPPRAVAPVPEPVATNVAVPVVAAAPVQRPAGQRSHHAKKKRKKQPVSSQSRNMQAAILALIEGYGHGGLSWMAEQLGLSPSTLRQRIMIDGGGFDAPTLFATVLLQSSKAEAFNTDGMTAEEPTTSGLFELQKFTSPDGNAVTWRTKE